MKIDNYSPTYVRLLDILFKTETAKTDVYQVKMDGTVFERSKTGFKSDHLKQDFYISTSDLWAICTPHEWYLVGRISAELKEYNALWHCPVDLKNNSSNRKAISGLLEKRVLIKTETTDIYVVNPFFVRRGDFKTVLATTASMLMDTKKVEIRHIQDKRAVSTFNPPSDNVPQLPNT